MINLFVRSAAYVIVGGCHLRCDEVLQVAGVAFDVPGTIWRGTVLSLSSSRFIGCECLVLLMKRGIM